VRTLTTSVCRYDACTACALEDLPRESVRFLVKPILSDDSTDLLPISGRVVIFSFWQSDGRSCCWLLVAHRLQERGRSYLIQQGPVNSMLQSFLVLTIRMCSENQRVCRGGQGEKSEETSDHRQVHHQRSCTPCRFRRSEPSYASFQKSFRLTS
jgi:hypothetical protein